MYCSPVMSAIADTSFLLIWEGFSGHLTIGRGIVLYINPAYTRNTGITEVLGKDIQSLIGPDKLFTGGAVYSVIQSKKSAFRLSTTYKTGTPLVGYVFGTPIFGEDGTLSQVVACSLPIVSLSSLREDFEEFLRASSGRTSISGST